MGDVHARVLQDRERVVRRADLQQRLRLADRRLRGEFGRRLGHFGGPDEPAEGRVRVALVEGLRAREQAGPGEQCRDGPVPVRVGQVGQHGVELFEQGAHSACGAGRAQPVVELSGRCELDAPQRDDLGVDRGGRGHPGPQALDGPGSVDRPESCGARWTSDSA